MGGWLDSPVVLAAIALAIGALMGLQRERAGSATAGLRTFALAGLLGALAALLSPVGGGWTIGAGVVALALLSASANRLSAKASGAVDPGMTTEVALIVAYAAGALIGTGRVTLGVAAGVGSAAVLQGKPVLHSLSGRLSDAEVRSILTFALITFVVLPVLPDEGMGPYDAVSPHHVWLMVVLVVGMSLGGYLAYRVAGERGGALLSGVLGGLISSTATTVSVARRVRGGAGAGGGAAVVLLATAVMYVRVVVEIGVAGGAQRWELWPPVLVVLGVAALVGLLCASVWRAGGTVGLSGSPTGLRTALAFGAVYAVVLMLVAWGSAELGGGGLYVVSALSGLTDMDAITLSASRMVSEGRIEAVAGWRAILIGGMSNLVFKLGLVGALGGWGLVRRVGPAFGCVFGASLLVMMLW